LFVKPCLTVLIGVVIYFNSLAVVSSVCEPDKTKENQLVRQIVKQAVEYNDWVNGVNYEQDLIKYYTGQALENILNAVKDFRKTSTDWYSLTFLQNCHIVYNDGNLAIAVVLLKEVDITNYDLQLLQAIFTLHKTTDGWRIINVDFPQTPYDNGFNNN